MTNPGEITRLLASLQQGESAAFDRLLPLLYEELRIVARRQLRGRHGQTLDTTSLVHEAYLKLVDQTQAQWQDRRHFLSVAAVAMRHILVDHARRRAAQKRGGDQAKVTLDDRVMGAEERTVEVLALDEALNALAAVDERLSRLVELRYFGGLSVQETAEVLSVSDRTVKRDWRKARAFLYSILYGAPAVGDAAPV